MTKSPKKSDIPALKVKEYTNGNRYGEEEIQLVRAGYEIGGLSPITLAKRFKIAPATVYKWKKEQNWKAKKDIPDNEKEEARNYADLIHRYTINDEEKEKLAEKALENAVFIAQSDADFQVLRNVIMDKFIPKIETLSDAKLVAEILKIIRESRLIMTPNINIQLNQVEKKPRIIERIVVDAKPSEPAN